MIRIGLATASYPLGPADAAGHFVAEHAGWLAGRGAAVSVVAAGGRGAPTPQPSGIQVHRVAGAGLFDRGGAPDALERFGRAWARVPGFAARYLAAVRRQLAGVDEIVAHWLVPGALAAALVRPGVPLTAIAHSGDVYLLARLGLVEVAARVLDRAGARLVFVSEPLRDEFFAGLSAARCRQLRRRLAPRARVVPMGIDVGGFAAVPRPRNPVPHVLFAGRLTPIKGADLLLDAVAMTAQPVRVTIAGAGPLRRSLERRARGNVRVVGPLSPAQWRRMLGAVDVFAAPSRVLASGRSEGMPVAVREAMAAGVPVLTSASGGLASLPAGVAEVVPAGDPRALAAGLERLLADSGRRDRLATAARGWVACQSWDYIGPCLTRFSDEQPGPGGPGRPPVTSGCYGVYAADRVDGFPRSR